MKLGNSVVNFIWLFFSSVAIKGIGVFRESIVAYTIGNSAEFATFNTLRAIVDFFLAFLIGVPIIETLLVPVYAGLYMSNRNISFRTLWNQTVKNSAFIFVIISVLLCLIVGIKSEYSLDTLTLILLFSLSLALSLSNSILFSLLKVTGNFKQYSYQAFLNASLILLLIFCFIHVIGLHALLVSSIATILISNYYIKKKLSPNFSSEADTLPKNIQTIDWKQVPVSRLIVINHAIFIGFIGRIIIGLGDNDLINLYQYSFILISSFILVFTSNIATLILYKSSVSGTDKMLKTIFVTFCVSVAANIFLYYFGELIISVIYQRGKFLAEDTARTNEFLKVFLIPFTLFSVTQIMVQPYLGQKNESGKKNVLIIAWLIAICVATSLIFGIYSSDYKTALIILLYASSISILVLLITKFERTNSMSKQLTYEEN